MVSPSLVYSPSSVCLLLLGFQVLIWVIWLHIHIQRVTLCLLLMLVVQRRKHKAKRSIVIKLAFSRKVAKYYIILVNLEGFFTKILEKWLHCFPDLETSLAHWKDSLGGVILSRPLSPWVRFLIQMHMHKIVIFFAQGRWCGSIPKMKLLSIFVCIIEKIKFIQFGGNNPRYL